LSGRKDATAPDPDPVELATSPSFSPNAQPTFSPSPSPRMVSTRSADKDEFDDEFDDPELSQSDLDVLDGKKEQIMVDAERRLSEIFGVSP